MKLSTFTPQLPSPDASKVCLHTLPFLASVVFPILLPVSIIPEIVLPLQFGLTLITFTNLIEFQKYAD
jgi:hypothetical protein